MSDESIGGFFVNLGVKTDNSIDKGIGKITDMTNSLSRLMGTIRNVSAASFALAGVTGAMETANFHTAELLNTSSDTVKMWQYAIDGSGASAKGFISTLTSLEQKLQDIKLGKIDTGLTESLTRLGINYLDFADMELTQRVKIVYEKASEVSDQNLASNLVGKILGTEGQKFYNYLQLTKKPLDELLVEAQSRIFTDTESQINAMTFNSEISALKNAIKEISSLSGSELGELFTPMISGINDFIEANNQLISSGIKTFFEDLQDLSSEVADGFEKVGSSFSKMLQTMTNSDTLESALEKIYNNFSKFTKDTNSLITDSFVNTFDFFEKLFTGDFKGAFEAWKKFYSDANKNVSGMFETKDQDFELNILNNAINNYKKNGKKTIYEDLPEDIKNSIASYYLTYGELTGINVKDIKKNKSDIEEQIKKMEKNIGVFDSKGNKITSNVDMNKMWWEENGGKTINDGIVKPNGEVINISPDDWVFALKDPSNLTQGIDPNFIKEIMPRTITGGANSITENITVNQTFNVSGGNNIPQTIKQQAQQGVIQGVGELIQRSSTRLQLMSGLK